LAPTRQRELLESGVAQPNDYDAGKGMEHRLQPNWTLKTTYFWRQTFTPARELQVLILYRPTR